MLNKKKLTKKKVNLIYTYNKSGFRWSATPAKESDKIFALWHFYGNSTFFSPIHRFTDHIGLDAV